MQHESSQVPRPTADQRIRQLEETLRLRDQFLGKLSHELGNLFLPFQFAVQLLRQSSSAAPEVDQVRSMLEEHGDDVRRFMADLRTVSRLVRKKLQLRRKAIDLKQIVSQSLTDAKPRIDKERLQLLVDLAAAPMQTEADPDLLRQMVDHLLRNAIQFTPSGGRVSVSLAQHDDGFVLRVADSGKGIPPDFWPQLFMPFAQADHSGPGWGAGLAIIRAVAELHGGSVEVSSPGPGQGCEFVVQLPRA